MLHSLQPVTAYATSVPKSTDGSRTSCFLSFYRTQPVVCKDSASESKAKENSAGFAFALPNAAYLMQKIVQVRAKNQACLSSLSNEA